MNKERSQDQGYTHPSISSDNHLIFISVLEISLLTLNEIIHQSWGTMFINPMSDELKDPTRSEDHPSEWETVISEG